MKFIISDHAVEQFRDRALINTNKANFSFVKAKEELIRASIQGVKIKKKTVLGSHQIKLDGYANHAVVKYGERSELILLTVLPEEESTTLELSPKTLLQEYEDLTSYLESRKIQYEIADQQDHEFKLEVYAIDINQHLSLSCVLGKIHDEYLCKQTSMLKQLYINKFQKLFSKSYRILKILNQLRPTLEKLTDIPEIAESIKYLTELETEVSYFQKDLNEI